MKVNFWQVLGIVLVIVGVIFVARKKMSSDDTVPATDRPAATETTR